MGSDNIIVEVTPEDFRSATDGYQNGKDGCVLHKALERLLPKGTEIMVLSHKVLIGGDRRKEYQIPPEWGSEEKNAPFSPEEIHRLSHRAKKSLEGIPTLSLTLTPV